MTPEEIRSITAGIAELNDRMTRLEQRVAEVRKLGQERQERVTHLEDMFYETDRCVAQQLFGPVEGEPVTGNTLSERVDQLEKVISNGEIKILIGGRAP